MIPTKIIADNRQKSLTTKIYQWFGTNLLEKLFGGTK